MTVPFTHLLVDCCTVILVLIVDSLVLHTHWFHLWPSHVPNPTNKKLTLNLKNNWHWTYKFSLTNFFLLLPIHFPSVAPNSYHRRPDWKTYRTQSSFTWTWTPDPLFSFFCFFQKKSGSSLSSSRVSTVRDNTDTRVCCLSDFDVSHPSPHHVVFSARLQKENQKRKKESDPPLQIIAPPRFPPLSINRAATVILLIRQKI